ncbi:MAG TPA: hypothetical protein PKB06_10055, partial [Actinotalea sp.]|nr:hypothetical protein [Actinotalea sp.]
MAERRPLAGPLLSRARSQWRLLAAALVVMVLGGASAGTGALLVATGGWHGLEAAAEQLDGDPEGADLVTVLAGIGGASATPAPHGSLLLDAVL